MISTKFFIGLLAFFGLLTSFGIGPGLASAYDILSYNDLPYCAIGCNGYALYDASFPGGCSGSNKTCHCFSGPWASTVKICVYEGDKFQKVGCENEPEEVKEDIIHFFYTIYCAVDDGNDLSSSSATAALSSSAADFGLSSSPVACTIGPVSTVVPAPPLVSLNATSTFSVASANVSTIVGASGASSGVSSLSSSPAWSPSLVQNAPPAAPAAAAATNAAPPASAPAGWTWEDVLLYGGGVLAGLLLLWVV